MTERRILLTRFEAVNVNYKRYGVYRMRIEASDAEGDDLDNYIFIYKRNPVSPYTNQNCDPFCAVVGPAQMAQYPPGEPDPDNNWPFYRLDFVELDFPSQTRADAAWSIIKQEACLLVEGLGKLTQLQAVETIWCPSPPDSISSQSESVSESLSE